MRRESHVRFCERLRVRFPRSTRLDIRITPPENFNVSIGRNQNKNTHIESRRQFYDWLAEIIRINGIHSVKRDAAFDDEKFRSGGIRLHYQTVTNIKSDLKEGILLEVGFDDVTPNVPKDISSWAYNYAANMVDVIDNRVKAVLCYDPGYTLVEKLQTISTKFRKQQNLGSFPANFLRHYYDVYCLLDDANVQKFIGTESYQVHKIKRFRSENPDITKNEAFLLNDPVIFKLYEQAYESTKSLYYRERPAFSDILKRIKENADRLS